VAVVVDLTDSVYQRWPDGETADVSPSGCLLVIDGCDRVVGGYTTGTWIKFHVALDEPTDLAVVETLPDPAQPPAS
jgi:hypothetical protein